MEEQMQAALSYIDRHREDMVQLWRNIVSMESPSADVEAVRRIASHLDTYCDAMGMQRKVYAFEHAGSTFTAQTDPGKWKPVALLGHMDTVHPVGSFGEEPFRIDGDTVYGPGTLDCKGGVVAAIYAIRALQHIGYTDRQLKLILSGDEEVAHALSDGESGRIFASETKDCAAVFNCESGFPNGEVTIRRKGGAVFVIEVFGKAAHAGKDPQKGASAIRQAAQMITEIEAQTVFDGTTYNCGSIAGGKGANIIPDYCKFSVGVRYCTNEQYRAAEALLQRLCDNPTVSGTHCRMRQNGFYPAMELTSKTEALLGLYQDSCRLLGQPVPQGVYQGGCSDSAFVAQNNIPVLCSLGVAGEGAHASDEHAQLSSISLQCKKLVATILSLPENF